MRELVLTGIKELWPKDETNAIFFASWCFAGNHKYKFWEQEKFTIAPSPWKTSKDILQASLYIDSLIDRIIPSLSNLMNNFHGVKYSNRFWKIYTINWLTHWLGHCYDRYYRLDHIKQKITEKVTVKILNNDIYPFKNFFDYTKIMMGYYSSMDYSIYQQNSDDYIKKMEVTHYYNLLLLSNIIKIGQFRFLDPQEFNILHKGGEEKDIQISIKGYYPKTAIAKKLVNFIKLMKPLFREYLNSSLYLGDIYGISLIDRFYLQFSCDPLFLLKKRKNDKLIENRNDRNNFIEQPLEFDAQNEFEKIIKTIILRYIPDSLITLYSRNGDDKPKIKIWLGLDIYHSQKDVYKIAEVCEYGGKWISTQHGAGYGEALSFPSGKIEYETSDGFITWGWNFQHIYPSILYSLPSPMLSKLPKHKQTKEQLLYVATMETPYPKRLYCDMQRNETINYLKDMTRFFQQVKKDICSKVKFRPYPSADGIISVEFLNNRFLSPDQFLLKCKIIKEFQNSKLVIIDHKSTSFLITLSMNVPTILFWNTEYFPVIPSAKVYFAKLHDAEILFDTPEEAAEKVNKIWHDVQGWWHQPEVQKAKDEFCYQFARTSKNWRKEWVEFLRGLGDKN